MHPEASRNHKAASSFPLLAIKEQTLNMTAFTCSAVSKHVGRTWGKVCGEAQLKNVEPKELVVGN